MYKGILTLVQRSFHNRHNLERLDEHDDGLLIQTFLVTYGTVSHWYLENIHQPKRIREGLSGPLTAAEMPGEVVDAAVGLLADITYEGIAAVGRVRMAAGLAGISG